MNNRSFEGCDSRQNEESTQPVSDAQNSHDNFSKDNSAKINNNITTTDCCCRCRSEAALSTCPNAPNKQIESNSCYQERWDNDGRVTSVDNQDEKCVESRAPTRTEAMPSGSAADGRPFQNATNRSNNLGAGGGVSGSKPIRDSCKYERNESTSSRYMSEDVRCEREEDCERRKRQRNQQMLKNNIPSQVNPDIGRGCGCECGSIQPVLQSNITAKPSGDCRCDAAMGGHMEINIPPESGISKGCGCDCKGSEKNDYVLNMPSTSKSRGDGLWNNVWKEEVKKCPNKVENGGEEADDGRGYTSSGDESWSGNEGEEDCCVYTYKGSLQADLPNSFLTLDKMANGLDLGGDEQPYAPPPPRSATSSPDNEFLEMDFDPGPSLDLEECDDDNDEMLENESLTEKPPTPPSEDQFLNENKDVEEPEVEPQPGPSRVASQPAPPRPPPMVLPVTLPATRLHPSLPHRGWSARYSWGNHSSSGDLCSPQSSGDPHSEIPEPLTMWNSSAPPRNPSSGGDSAAGWNPPKPPPGPSHYPTSSSSAPLESDSGDTRNLFSDLYHCIMAKRLVMEKNASFTEVKDDSDAGHEDTDFAPVERTMIWSEHEACTKQVTQVATSACGATAVINAMIALDFPFAVDKIMKGVSTRLRQDSAPIPAYLASRSVAGATHEDLIRGVEAASHGRLYARFFHMHPERRFSLSKWLSYWMKKGAVAIATLNLQAGLPPAGPMPDAWHHQMIFGVSERGVFVTNPLECVAESALMPQLCSPSILKVKRSDVLQRWSSSCDLMPLFRPPDVRWKQLNVLGQVVNMIRESMAGGPAGRTATLYVTIPAAYQSGITLIIPADAPACQELREAPELPLLLSQPESPSTP